MSTSRREQILSSAADLFATRGFHGVSVHEIGAACGVSGPALYRHFASKDAMLARMLIGISEELLEQGRARARDASGPGEALRALVRWHIDFALTHPALIVVQEREWATLQSSDRDRVRLLQRRYIDEWVDVVRRLRSDLDRPTARAAVQAVFGLLNSTPHSARLSEQAMRDLLESLALSALLP